MKRVVVLVSGNGSNLQALIDRVHGRFGEIVGVVSDRSDVRGLERAEHAGITSQIVSFERFRSDREGFDRRLAEVVSSFEPDLVVLAGFMRILGSSFLDRFPQAVINLHPALPGAFPGLNAMRRAWDAQEAVAFSGVMVHEVTSEVDVGPVLGTTVVPFGATFEAFELAMHAAEHDLLVDVVANWAHPAESNVE